MVLGTYPSRRYHKSWVTQRLLNNAPVWAHMRTCPVSVANQVTNYEGTLVEETIQQLMEERDDHFLSLCDPTLLDHLYKAELSNGFFFTEETYGDDRKIFTPPTVYAEINGSEEQISIAEFNDIRSLYYEALPTRIEYGDTQHIWQDVIPVTDAGDILSTEPNAMVLQGFLYITLSDNLVWERNFREVLYFSKVTITGTSRKGAETTEVVPLRLNGTFQTVNQWRSIDEIYLSHLSPDAQVTVSALPFAEDPIVDNMNLAVPVENGDRVQFLSLVDESFGSTLVGTSYLNSDMDIVRMDIPEMRTDYQIELLDENSDNVTLNGILPKPYSQMLYAIDDLSFYVYDRRLAYPDVSGMTGESADCRMELTLPDHDWIYVRGETASVTTRTVDVLAIPTEYRWSVTVPDGTVYRVGADGTYYSEDTDAWITNDLAETNKWEEKSMDFAIDQTGEYIVEFMATYEDPDGEVAQRTSKLLLYVPSIQPEVQIALPESLRGCQKMAFDADGQFWFYNGTSIFLVNLYHDYFMVDYEAKDVWLREKYNEIRVVP